jgi:hypothetical protein
MFGLDPTSRIALRLRRWRNRLGIAAPRVAVRTDHPWHWRAWAVGILAACSLALAGWIYDAGMRFAGFYSETSAQELSSLREQVATLTLERDEFNRVASSSESRLRIESTAHERLVTQLRSLEEENTRLKADLAALESLVGNDQAPSGLEISRMQVVSEGDGQRYRYRLVLVHRGSDREREFRGRLQLLVYPVQGAAGTILEFPAKTEQNLAQYSVSIRRYGRVEGGFSVASGIKVQRVEARILDESGLRASASQMLVGR